MRKRTQGFTLVEMMMGMFITSITGMAVAGVSMVLSTAYSHSENHYDAMESARSAMRRVQFSLQSAALVTAVSADGTKLAYWRGDENSDGQVNLLELRLLDYDSISGQLVEHRIQFPELWSEDKVASENKNKDLMDAVKMDKIEEWILGSPYLTSLTYAAGVTKTVFSPSPAVPLSTLVSISAAFQTGDQVVTLNAAAALRADLTDYIYLAGSDYRFIPTWEESWK